MNYQWGFYVASAVALLEWVYIQFTRRYVRRCGEDLDILRQQIRATRTRT